MKPDYQKIIEDIYYNIHSLDNTGKVPTYIPELANVDPEKFAISMRTIQGDTCGIGDYTERFSIQSISKVFTLSLAIHLYGDKVWDRVDVEPSGTPFNSLVRLEHEDGIPRNPFINAGAIVISDILVSLLDNPKKDFLEFIHLIHGDDRIQYNESIAQSEYENGYRNIALTNFMKSFDNIKNDADEVLDFYFYSCSLDMSCQELADCFQLFARYGKSARSDEIILERNQVKRINALMLTCGFYDESGEFAFRVGLPGKSGVGGGIAAVYPDDYSIAVWSPKLNEHGNSSRGMHALELFTTKTNMSIF